jgi:hypothetical protein
MEPQVARGCHATTATGQQCKSPVRPGSWFCAEHQAVSTLDAVWEIDGTLVRVGDMSREQVRALMDEYAEAAALVRTREIAEETAMQRKPS